MDSKTKSATFEGLTTPLVELATELNVLDLQLQCITKAASVPIHIQLDGSGNRPVAVHGEDLFACVLAARRGVWKAMHKLVGEIQILLVASNGTQMEGPPGPQVPESEPTEDAYYIGTDDPYDGRGWTAGPYPTLSRATDERPRLSYAFIFKLGGPGQLPVKVMTWADGEWRLC